MPALTDGYVFLPRNPAQGDHDHGHDGSVTGSHDKLNVNAETHHYFGCWFYP